MENDRQSRIAAQILEKVSQMLRSVKSNKQAEQRAKLALQELLPEIHSAIFQLEDDESHSNQTKNEG